MSLQSITYYEAIMQYKDRTNTPLLLQDVANWRLCRTCLAEETSDIDFLDLRKDAVVDTDGNTMTAEYMLQAILEIAPDDLMPLIICKECFNRITQCYFFAIQAKRAQNVLQLLVDKLETSDTTITTTEENFEDVTSTADLSLIENESTISDEIRNATAEVHDLLDDSSVESLTFDEKNNCDNTTSDKKQSFCTEDLEDDRINISFHNIETEDITYVSSDIQDLDDIQDLEDLEDTQPLDDMQNLNDVQNLNNIKEGSTEMLILSESEYNESNNDIDDNYDSGYNAVNTDLVKDGQEETRSNTEDENSLNVIEKLKKKPKIPRRSRTRLLSDFTCLLCSKKFKVQRRLVEHANTAHPGKKVFPCYQCDSTFSHIQSLSRHMHSHNPAQFINKCEQCGKGFLRSDDLKRHMRVHTGERPYECGLCDAAFKQVNELKDHENSHSTEKNFMCTVCTLRFSSRNGLYMHMKVHHPR